MGEEGSVTTKSEFPFQCASLKSCNESLPIRENLSEEEPPATLEKLERLKQEKWQHYQFIARDITRDKHAACGI